MIPLNTLLLQKSIYFNIVNLGKIKICCKILIVKKSRNLEYIINNVKFITVNLQIIIYEHFKDFNLASIDILILWMNVSCKNFLE